MGLRSMTGFGAAQAVAEEGSVVAIELRAVNHRHREVRVRAGRGGAPLVPLLEARAAGLRGRGRFDVLVTVERPTARPGGLALNVPRARAAYGELVALWAELRPGEAVPLDAVLRVPGVFRASEDEASGADAVANAVGPSPLTAAAERALDDAFADLDRMRAAEGANLVADLRARLATLRAAHGELAARTEELSRAHFERLRGRIAKLLEGLATVPEERIAQEAAALADRGDVAEELTRFASHLAQFEEALGRADEPQGKRLDFLLQEFAREVNTTASKAQDSGVAHLVVAMKVEIERLREQVQNLE